MENFKIIKKYWYLLLIAFIVAGFMMMNMHNDLSDRAVITNSDNGKALDIENSSTVYYIEVLGQVKNPGVYEVDREMLVIEAIYMAGGFTQDADLYYVHKNVALSQLLKPFQKVFVPAISNSSWDSYQDPGKLNINTASKEQLTAIYGVGEATADKVIANRPYENIEDLAEIPGIRKDILEILLEVAVL